MKVQNKGGTSKRSPNCPICGTWIEHWYNSKGLIDAIERIFYRTCCARCGAQDNLVGGHVIKSSSLDQREYIIPLCSKCNTKDCGIPFEVDAGLLVPAVHDKK